jgi:hypothetical protein
VFSSEKYPRKLLSGAGGGSVCLASPRSKLNCPAPHWKKLSSGTNTVQVGSKKGKPNAY